MFSSCEPQHMKGETMNLIAKWILILASAWIMAGCSQTPPPRESIFDSNVHIEDSLILTLPSYPRLCDEIDLEKRMVDIGDVKLYCEIEGAGTPLVLINGGPGSSHHTFHPWLSAAKSDFKVIYYDQRGCGVSDYEPGPGYSFEQAVEDLEKLRIALKIEKWIILGHSYGGGVAQYYTIKYPGRVIGQVLVGSVPMFQLEDFQGGGDQEFYAEPERAKIDELRSLVINGKINVAQYQFNKDINGGWKRGNYYKPTRERLIQMGLYDFVADPAYSSDWGVYDFNNFFLDCPVPTLILEGKYDLIWKANRPNIMAKYHPQAKVVVLDHAGHNMFADQPQRFVQEIKDWADNIQQPHELDLTRWSGAIMEKLSPQLELIASSKAFIHLIREQGIAVASAEYTLMKGGKPEALVFFEVPMINLGYEYLFAGKVSESVKIFKLITVEYPGSWNAFDSYGQALLEAGEVELAKQNYLRSIELNPENENGISVLKKLEAG